MTEYQKPRCMQASCYNATDGCSNTITYMGVGPVRKLCPVCQEAGTPSERHRTDFNLGKAIRKFKAEPLTGLDLNGAVCFEVTVWPKTVFGGRVMPCKTEG